VLDSSEAAAARLEVQRRLISVRGDDTAVASGLRSPGLAALTALVVTLSAGGLYAWLGAPSLPDLPFVVAQAKAHAQQAQQDQATSHDPDSAGSKPPNHGDFRAAAEKLREKLKAEPNNAEGWELYARTESRIGEYQLATDAYARSIELGRKTPSVFDGYGEMLVLGAQGVVLPAAKEAFAQALRLAPGDVISRFYLALADSQAGEAHKAVDAWLSLAADIPADDEMRDELANRIAVTARAGGFDAPKLPDGPVASAPPPNPATGGAPTQAQVKAAANMSDADREKMITAMIAQLAAKLAKEPNDFEGWIKLANAYAVQNQTDKAVEAFDHAAALKPGDPTIKLEAVAALLAPLQPADPIPPKAVTLLHEVSAAAPEAPEVLWYLGVVDARQGRLDQARKNWTQLLGDLEDGSQDKKMVQAALAQLDQGIKQ
jgi:cytochrome c-type biogenesis protein CcmH